MSTFDTDPQSALRASVTASPDGGVQIATTSVTVEPDEWPLTINKGQTWTLYASWSLDSAVVDTTAGTVTLTARAEAGGTAVLSITGTGGTAYMTFAQTAAQTAALGFVRARYVLDHSSGGTVTRLLTGPVDLVNSGMA